jgi:DNA repair protein RecN (Recombination protein N)
LTVVNKLKRKYGGAVAEILDVLAAKRARLAELEDRDAIIVQLEAKLADSKKVLSKLADKLTKARTAAAEKLARAVTKELRDLGFLQAKFSVRIEPISPASHGADKIDYMFEPNPGESARTLAQIASSGETARVMLAVKSVLAAHDSSATLVFDEIDANIGGEVGEIVGMKMRAVAKHRQVIAITHLPQSAVFGNRHLVVAKSVADGRTRTKISEVEGSARVSEIARMLGGEKLTSVVKKHAEELLSIPR